MINRAKLKTAIENCALITINNWPQHYATISTGVLRIKDTEGTEISFRLKSFLGESTVMSDGRILATDTKNIQRAVGFYDRTPLKLS